MEPLITTLAVLTASCALTMALAMAWGRRQLRHPGSMPVTLFADDPALGCRLWLHKRRDREARRRRRAPRHRHPLTLRCIYIAGWSLLRLFAAVILLAVILLTCALA